MGRTVRLYAAPLWSLCRRRPRPFVSFRGHCPSPWIRPDSAVGLHSLLRLSPRSAPSELLLLFLTSPSFPGPAFIIFFPFSECYPHRPTLRFSFGCFCRIFQRSEADVLGTCSGPESSEKSGRVASENRTSDRPKLGLNGEAFLAKGPLSPFPREGCSLKNFPCAQRESRQAS